MKAASRRSPSWKRASEEQEKRSQASRNQAVQTKRWGWKLEIRNEQRERERERWKNCYLRKSSMARRWPEWEMPPELFNLYMEKSFVLSQRSLPKAPLSLSLSLSLPPLLVLYSTGRSWESDLPFVPLQGTEDPKKKSPKNKTNNFLFIWIIIIISFKFYYFYYWYNYLFFYQFLILK